MIHRHRRHVDTAIRYGRGGYMVSDTYDYCGECDNLHQPCLANPNIVHIFIIICVIILDIFLTFGAWFYKWFIIKWAYTSSSAIWKVVTEQPFTSVLLDESVIGIIIKWAYTSFLCYLKSRNRTTVYQCLVWTYCVYREYET